MSESQKKVDLRRYAYILNRRKWLLIIPFAAALAVGGVGSFAVKPMYRCVTAIMWDYGQPLSQNLENIVARPAPQDQLARLHNEMQSTDFLHRIILATGLDKNSSSIAWAKGQQKKYPDMSIEDLTELRNIQILRNLIRADARGDEGNVFRIMVDFPDPKIARAIALSIGNAFMDATRSSQMDQVRAAEDFSMEQRTLYREKLAESERKLEEFQRRALTSDLTTTAIDRTNLPAVQSQRDQAGIAVEDARARRDQFLDRARALSPSASELPGLSSGALQQDRAQIESIERQSARAMASAPPAAPGTPEMVDPQLVSKRQDALNEIRSLVATHFAAESPDFRSAAERYMLSELDLAAAQARRDGYQGLIGSAMAQVSSTPERANELQRLQSEVDMNREFYNTFLQQIASAQISSAFEAAKAGGRVVILEPPALPLKPYKPNRMAIMLLSGLGGMLAGVGLVVLLETHDTGLHDPDEVKEFLGIDVVGSLPRLEMRGSRAFAQDGRGSWPDVAGVPTPAPWVREAYAKESPGGYELRRLAFMLSSRQSPEPGPRAVLITSARRGEGKSTVAALFAVALARRAEHRVALVDFDLRRPALQRFFNVPPDHHGVIEALRDHRLTSEHMIEVLPGRLTLFPSGKLAEFRSEFLETEAAAWLLDQIRVQYTHVVVDSAPNIPVPDAMILAQEVDKVLYVLRMGSTPRDLARWGLNLQIKARDNVAGVVLNDAEKVLPYYAGYRDYYAYESQQA